MATANIMFARPAIELAQRDRSGGHLVFSEVIATFGLIGVVHATGKRPNVVPLVVAAYIAATYWFTSSERNRPHHRPAQRSARR